MVNCKQAKGDYQ